MKRSQYQLELRFGSDLLEAGFTAIPNLFLQHYRHLGLSDSEALWIIHLLRFKWSSEAPCPKQSNIPMGCSQKTRRRYARHLRKLGLLFTRRVYHTPETAPRPDLVGKMRALEYHFDALFHNLLRIESHLKTGKPLETFVIELPAEIVRQVALGKFHDVPNRVKKTCEGHIADGEDGALLLPQNGGVDTTTPKPTTRKTGSSTTTPKPTTRKTGRHKEDSCSKEEATRPKEKAEVAEERNNPAPAPAQKANHLTYQLLSDFGITGSPLTELASDERISPKLVRAWLLYLDTQDFEGKPGYLVNQLRAHHRPPAPFPTLGKLSEEQLSVLKSLVRSRQWTAQWDQDKLIEAGIEIETAEIWYEHMSKRQDH
jgi:hypothetical protein